MEIPTADATDSIVPPGKHVAKTRILVVDEHPLLRHGIVAFINGQPDMIACGEADCIPGARSKIAECKPQLLLTALRLGTGDSLEFVKALKAEYPSLLILVYSAFEEAIFAERALRAGANGYLMKKAAKEEMVPPFAMSCAVRFMSAGIWPCARSKNRWKPRNKTALQ
jgi:DNA-binding NarL/FixJ family response regulator